MKTIYTLLSLTALLLSLIGCRTEMDVRPIEGKRKLVLNAIAKGGDEELFYSISHSTLYTDPSSMNGSKPKVRDYEIKLQVNGEPITESEEGAHNYFICSLKGGDKVDFYVHAPNFESISASTTIPIAPTMGAIRLEELEEKVKTNKYPEEINGQELVRREYFKEYILHIPVSRGSESRNFFHLLGSYTQHYGTNERYENEKKVNIEFEDPIIEKDHSNNFILSFQRNKYALFSDDNFPGDSYTITQRISFPYKYAYFANKKSTTPVEERSYHIEKISVMIELSAISEDLYLYCKSKTIADSSQDNPLSEPTQIYTNIHNGIGILGAYTPIQQELEVNF